VAMAQRVTYFVKRNCSLNIELEYKTRTFGLNWPLIIKTKKIYVGLKFLSRPTLESEGKTVRICLRVLSICRQTYTFA